VHVQYICSEIASRAASVRQAWCVRLAQLPLEAAYLYDAVWIYARAANHLVAHGYDPSDGRRILDHIRGTTYKSECSAAGTKVASVCVRGLDR